MASRARHVIAASVLGLTSVAFAASHAGCVGDDVAVGPTASSGGTSGTSGDPDGGGGGGGACTTNNQCGTSFCVDGVCCAAPCTGQCESCREPGKEGQCVPVTGVPRAGKAACTGAGDALCGGTCDGANRTACGYPTTDCRPGSCTNGTVTNVATCAQGVCPASTTKTCASTLDTKVCGATSCVGVTQVVAGYDFSCALMTDQTVRCWGAGGAGQLGQGAADVNDHLTPVAVKGLSGVTKLTASGAYFGRVCALLSDQTAKCWGSGAFGTLGTGALADSAVPLPVLKAAGMPFAGIKDISAGQNVTCLLDTTGQAWCWGYQGEGTVGDGVSTATNRLYPAAISGGGTGNSAISVGYNHACMTTTATNTSGVRCWGANGNLSVGTTGATSFSTAQTMAYSAANGSIVRPIGVGGERGTSCVIANNSTLSCWGGNAFGQLGRNTNGSATNTATPQPVCSNAACSTNMTLVKSFGVGEQHACAVHETFVKCWGRSNHGELGDGDVATLHSSLFAAGGPALPTAARQIAVGAFHSCVLLADQTVRCWGWNSNGQLGTGGTDDTAVPVMTAF